MNGKKETKNIKLVKLCHFNFYLLIIAIIPFTIFPHFLYMYITQSFCGKNLLLNRTLKIC